MALFKKKVSMSEYGGAVLYVARDWVTNDALGGLGRCFPDFDGSKGWPSFFESKGYSEGQMTLYLRMAYHCSLQAMALQYDAAVRRDMVIGAMSQFRSALAGYDSVAAFSALENAYSGQPVFDPSIARLSDGLKVSFLPVGYQTAHLANARFLLAEVLIPEFKDVAYVMENFGTFSGAIASCIGVVERARAQVATQVKV